MAFTLANWDCLSNTVNVNVVNAWTYHLSTDALATIKASAYFNDRINFLKVGDVIFIKGSDGREMLAVTSVTGNVTVESYIPSTIETESITTTGLITSGGLTLTDVLTFSDGATIDNTDATTLTLTETKIVLEADTNYIGNTAKTAYNRLAGYTKFDLRPAGGSTNSYCVQMRSYVGGASGAFWGFDGETHVTIDGTASVRGVQGVAVLDSTYTATGATYIGTYGQARSDGTFAGSGFLVGLYGLIEASAAITASHVCSAWLDSHQANTVTGSHQLLYMTNNGAATMDEAIYIYGGHKITSLMALDTCNGMVSATAETGGTSAKIKITIDGTVYYINAYTG